MYKLELTRENSTRNQMQKLTTECRKLGKERRASSTRTNTKEQSEQSTPIDEEQHYFKRESHSDECRRFLQEKMQSRKTLHKLEEKKVQSIDLNQRELHYVPRDPVERSVFNTDVLCSRGKRSTLVDLERKKAENCPPYNRLKLVHRPPLPKSDNMNSSHANTRSNLNRRITLETLEQEKSEYSPQTQTKTRISARRNLGELEGTRSSLEKKIINAKRFPPHNRASTSELLAQRQESDRKGRRSMRELEMMESKHSELDSNKRLSVSPQPSRRPLSTGLTSRRRLSLAELFRERSIAAAGMGVTLRDRSVASAATRISNRSDGDTLKGNKTDVRSFDGDEIDLDQEFALIRTIDQPLKGERRESENAIVPGAVAVFAPEYASSDELEIDFMEIDTSGMQERPSSFFSERVENDEITEAVDIVTERDVIHELSDSSTKKFHGIGLRFCCSLVFFVFIVCVVTLSALIAVKETQKTKNNGTPDGNYHSSDPTAVVLSRSPSISPTVSVPSLSFRPSQIPSIAPSLTQWKVGESISGSSFGHSVQFSYDLITFSDKLSIRVYQFQEGKWREHEQNITGEEARLSNNHRIAVKDGNSLKVLELSQGYWSQLGSNIDVMESISAFSISGDGSTVSITGYRSSTSQESQVYRFERSEWFQYGSSIFEGFEDSPRDMSLTFDGSQLVIGYFRQSASFAILYYSPDSDRSDWISDVNELFPGGPSVAISEDGSYLLCAGDGYIDVVETEFSVQREIARLEVTESNSSAIAALSNDGKSVAFFSNRKLEVYSLDNSAWVKKGEMPDTHFDIESIAFSPDGSLALGQPKKNLVQILRLD
jgi:WD40-like Beta Propeller Repeat